MPDRNLNLTHTDFNRRKVETQRSTSGTVFSSREALQAKDGLKLVLRMVHQIAGELHDPRLAALALRGTLYIRALT